MAESEVETNFLLMRLHLLKSYKYLNNSIEISSIEDEDVKEAKHNIEEALNKTNSFLERIIKDIEENEKNE